MAAAKPPMLPICRSMSTSSGDSSAAALRSARPSRTRSTVMDDEPNAASTWAKTESESVATSTVPTAGTVLDGVGSLTRPVAGALEG